jgi:hypothetical protein
MGLDDASTDHVVVALLHVNRLALSLIGHYEQVWAFVRDVEIEQCTMAKKWNEMEWLHGDVKIITAPVVSSTHPFASFAQRASLE